MECSCHLRKSLWHGHLKLSDRNWCAIKAEANHVQSTASLVCTTELIDVYMA